MIITKKLEVEMSLMEVKRIGRDFCLHGNIMTERYYSGTHQIVLTGECVGAALDALDLINSVIFFYDDDYYCYVVAPELSESEFFELIVKVVESAVINISDEDGSYIVKRKIPATPKLPEKHNAPQECIDGLLYHKATINFGRGYGQKFSKVDILLSYEGRRTIYRVQRYNNELTGAKIDGEAKIFAETNAQWEAVCFAYGINPNEGDAKEAAQRAKKFVYAIVGELMNRFWSSTNQTSYLSMWEAGQKELASI